MENLDPTVFEKAAEVLKKNKWTKRTLARDKDGFDIRPTSPYACRFCAAGAICRVLGDDRADVTTKSAPYLDFLVKEMGLESMVGDWNDNLSDKRIVIRRFLKTAKALRENKTAPPINEEVKRVLPNTIPAGTVYEFMNATFVTLEPAEYNHWSKAYTGAKNVDVSCGYIGGSCFVEPDKIKFKK